MIIFLGERCVELHHRAAVLCRWRLVGLLTTREESMFLGAYHFDGELAAMLAGTAG